MKVLSTIITSVLLIVFTACGSESSNAKDGNHNQKSETSLNDLEASGTYTENLVGNKLKINGYIKNYSQNRAYKNVEIKIDFYGKKGNLLGSEYQTVTSTVNPGSKTTYKMKVNNYSNVSKIGWSVIDAELY